MQAAIRFAMLTWLAMSAPLWAQNKPVVVELFTSQGCSSCPPADQILTKLAGRDDVIALALHVDYWDYIGWKDSFADPRFTKRQKAYARAAGSRSVYTPQFIIGGRDSVVGAKAMDLAEQITAHSRTPYPIALKVTRRENVYRVSADPAGDGYQEIAVQVVRYSPEQTVKIARGENAGRKLSYSNVVTSWEEVSRWRGDKALNLRVEGSAAEPTVVLLQAVKSRAILGAVALR